MNFRIDMDFRKNLNEMCNSLKKITEPCLTRKLSVVELVKVYRIRRWFPLQNGHGFEALLKSNILFFIIKTPECIDQQMQLTLLKKGRLLKHTNNHQNTTFKVLIVFVNNSRYEQKLKYGQLILFSSNLSLHMPGWGQLNPVQVSSLWFRL